MSENNENDIITARQTVAHTIQSWLHGPDTPCGSRLPSRKAQQTALRLSQNSAILTMADVTQQQRAAGGEYIILVCAQKYIYITVHLQYSETRAG